MISKYIGIFWLQKYCSHVTKILLNIDFYFWEKKEFKYPIFSCTELKFHLLSIIAEFNSIRVRNRLFCRFYSCFPMLFVRTLGVWCYGKVVFLVLAIERALCRGLCECFFFKATSLHFVQRERRYTLLNIESYSSAM